MESKETVFVTGATGVIGSMLVKKLLSQKYKVVCLVRNEDKARRLLGSNADLCLIVGDVTKENIINEDIDYIIHAASQTSSKAFVQEPVETMMVAIQGTRNMLELARDKKVKSFVYLSTMEIYGTPQTDEKISEQHGTNIDTMTVRSSYPESKRACESLCQGYYSEYGVPIKVLRLTQTFGHAIDYFDGRVFAEFARCKIEKRNIILHTEGKTKRSYLSSSDAVEAILTVMLKGKDGEAYNVANEETYCSIYEMAKLVAGTDIDVEIQVDNENHGYAPELHMNLDTRKIQNLGWAPNHNLNDMFGQLIMEMNEMRKFSGKKE